MFYRGAWAAIVCFDLGDMDSFDRVKFWITELKNNEEVKKSYKIFSRYADFMMKKIRILIIVFAILNLMTLRGIENVPGLPDISMRHEERRGRRRQILPTSRPAYRSQLRRRYYFNRFLDNILTTKYSCLRLKKRNIFSPIENGASYSETSSQTGENVCECETIIPTSGATCCNDNIQTINQSIKQSINQSIHQSINQLSDRSVQTPTAGPWSTNRGNFFFSYSNHFIPI